MPTVHSIMPVLIADDPCSLPLPGRPRSPGWAQRLLPGAFLVACLLGILRSGPCMATGPANETVIDVLAVYTAAARDGAGGSDAIRTAILDGFQQANRIYTDSHTATRLQPVAVIESDFVENGSIINAAQSIRANGTTLRNNYRADLLLIFVENDQSGFYLAFGAGVPGPAGNSAAAFGAILRTTPLGLGNGIATRTGFALGCGVDLPGSEAFSRSGAFADAFSHRFLVDGMAMTTVMGDSARMRIPHFSNPDVLYRGIPTGIAGESDNASAIRRLAPTVAGYQKCTNRVQFATHSATVSEGAGSVTLQLLRTGPADTTARIRASTVTGTAQAGSEFTAVSEVVEFAPGETSRPVVVPILANDARHGPRSFRVRLDQAAVGTGIGWNGEVAVTVLDDDSPVRFESPEAALEEGGSPILVRVMRTHAAPVDQELALHLDIPTATDTQPAISLVAEGAGAHGPLPASVRIPPGTPFVDIALTVARDGIARPDTLVPVSIILGTPAPTNTWNTLSLWVRDTDRPDSIDATYPSSVGTNLLGAPVAPLPDGGFIAAIRPFPGAAVRLIRVLPAGGADPAFQPPTFHDLGDPSSAGLWAGQLNRIVRQPDGRLIVGGYFASVNGIPKGSLVRLNADGSIDSSFAQGGTGILGFIQDLCLQPGGEILVVGEFAAVHGAPRLCAARLFPDGVLDESFKPLFADSSFVSLRSVAIQGDRILIGGHFESVNSLNRPYLTRLQLDGSVDNSFRHLFTGSVDGLRIVPGQGFYSFGSYLLPREYAGKSNPAGPADARHRYRGLNGRIDDILPLPGGESIVAGSFTGAAGAPSALVRYRADGAVEETFGLRLAPHSRVAALVPGPAGELTLVGRLFLPGEARPRNLLRLRGGTWRPELALPNVSSGGTRMEALTVPGLEHSLERRTADGNWETIDTVQPTANTHAFLDAFPTPAAFYRIRAGSPPPNRGPTTTP